MNILVVCTGNTCRSPMAEGLLKKYLDCENKIESAGIFAIKGSFPSEYASTVIKDIGIDIYNYKSKPISKNLIRNCDIILTMTKEHKDQLLEIANDLNKEIYTIKEFAFEKEEDILDPCGEDLGTYRRTLQEIEDCVKLISEKVYKRRSSMKIAIGSDHGGFELKEIVKKELESQNIEFMDFGTNNNESVDYPDYGKKVAEKVAEGEFDRGIVICGTGIGISIAANKVKGIRCALCGDTYSAKMAMEHNNSNVLALGARVIGIDLAKEIVDTWLKASFQGGRHERRVNKIMMIEES